MSVLLFISTIVLDLAGVAFAATYIWLNSFSKITDLASRNTSILKISRVSMVLSLVFALLSCLLTNSGTVDGAISRATILYSIIAISWLVVLLGCGVAMYIAFISKTTFKDTLLQSFKKIFSIAITGAIVGMILAWLLG